jgi:hypothetical protein
VINTGLGRLLTNNPSGARQAVSPSSLDHHFAADLLTHGVHIFFYYPYIDAPSAVKPAVPNVHTVASALKKALQS